MLHIGLKALTALSTPQTDFTQIGNAAFLRAGMTNEQMIGIIERFQAWSATKMTAASAATSTRPWRFWTF